MKSNQPVFRHLLATQAIARSAEAEEGSAEAPAKGKSRSTFTKEQIAEIRTLRAERHADGDKAGKPVYSHAKLAEMFGTTAGGISQIVRNRTYKDPDYTPVNDGN